ncbi:6-carboxytetrahydropterin synthase QueD [Algisphaera agarilytica]|uniref:6-carboxy-5,6,7,8-tetrahydropterin synthase n=1 Tax=Algisphaera agarilytica TaxID=1385975 RepID=A0A7X0LJ85_9BACT|nr:6-carboxytetrahydropterin synthase QueD [Algisphaera agarilytica]MBB6428519.1 6-pyruvoyltetrahydropterin/6-carboxytetrahydropterin synthase [Algisphaera agarilytica]
MKTRIIRKFSFDAAHQLFTMPEWHKCRRMHGHTYLCEVVCEGEVDPEVGFFLDYGDLKTKIDPIVQQLDHHYLNDIPGLQVPTAEMIAKWIYEKLKPELPSLAILRLWETPNNGVEYAPSASDA